jgi:diaminopimelate epimerase
VSAKGRHEGESVPTRAGAEGSTASALAFTKMQGLGNDFVVVDATTRPFELTPAQIRRLADRRFGVGCDQVLVVLPPRSADVDFGYRIFNADGGEVEQCGNGARCFVVFVRAKGLTDKREIRVETRGGVIVPRLEDDGRVTVDMGVPRFAPEAVPFVEGSGAAVERLDVDGASIEVSVLSMGNPHAVQIVADVDAAPVTTQGPRIECHPRFPARVNAGYMQVVDRDTIRLRVWERGAGETLACGTGACAAVVAGRRRGRLDACVTVATRGGVLAIRWDGDGCPVWMTGPAAIVFEGRWPVASA